MIVLLPSPRGSKQVGQAVFFMWLPDAVSRPTPHKPIPSRRSIRTQPQPTLSTFNPSWTAAPSGERSARTKDDLQRTEVMVAQLQKPQIAHIMGQRPSWQVASPACKNLTMRTPESKTNCLKKNSRSWQVNSSPISSVRNCPSVTESLVHHRVNNNLSLVLVLNQINLIFHFNNILPPPPGFLKQSTLFNLFHEKFVRISYLSSVLHAPPI
jgi:hypothetical protein